MINQKSTYLRSVFFLALGFLLVMLAFSKTYFIVTTDHSYFNYPGFIRQTIKASAEAVLFLWAAWMSVTERFSEEKLIVTAALFFVFEGIYHLVMEGMAYLFIACVLLTWNIAGGLFLLLFYRFKKGRIICLILAAPVLACNLYENYYNFHDYMMGYIGGITALDLIEEAGGSACKLIFVAGLLIFMLLHLGKSAGAMHNGSRISFWIKLFCAILILSTVCTVYLFVRENAYNETDEGAYRIEAAGINEGAYRIEAAGINEII